MLGDFGQEVERIEHLEVARRSRHQFLVARLGKSAHCIVLALVDDLARLRHLDHWRLAEWTSQEVLDQAL